MPIPRRLFAVLAVAAVLGSVARAPEPVSAASCSGNSHAMKLTNGQASPGKVRAVAGQMHKVQGNT